MYFTNIYNTPTVNNVSITIQVLFEDSTLWYYQKLNYIMHGIVIAKNDKF